MKHEKLQIIEEHGHQKGIRDRSGYLIFFTDVSRYTGQDERYKRELIEKRELAEYLLAALEKRE